MRSLHISRRRTSKFSWTKYLRSKRGEECERIFSSSPIKAVVESVLGQASSLFQDALAQAAESRKREGEALANENAECKVLDPCPKSAASSGSEPTVIYKRTRSFYLHGRLLLKNAQHGVGDTEQSGRQVALVLTARLGDKWRGSWSDQRTRWPGELLLVKHLITANLNQRN